MKQHHGSRLYALVLFACLSTPAFAQPKPASGNVSAAATDAIVGEDSAWQASLQQVVRGVVAIRVTGVRDFDTESAGSSVGTGFVVDRARGIILSNRHMVHAGPVKAQGVLLNNEEIPLQPLYRDPVHDFGFYRFDPNDVRFMDLHELPLAPDAARVGMEIRVVGNDAGEKLSILDGTLARLDRNAPKYGNDKYNDFNTFYYQAASNTSGGSSGSPVVDEKGRVVALNAGGATRAASSFYLPLDRVTRALTALQQGEVPTRGTLQAVYEHTSFDELRRLGLTAESEARVRAAAPDEIGMLVVTETVPGGPVDGQLRPGDIMLEANGALLFGFTALEALLDERVGEPISLVVERGGARLDVEATVGDLHAITPDRYLEVGRAIVHDLSYQQARNHKVPVRGVYVAIGGYQFSAEGINRGSLITHLDGEPVPDLAAMKALLASKAHGQRVRVRYSPVSESRKSYETVVTMDRLWFVMQQCVRDDRTGLWPCVEVGPPPETPKSVGGAPSLVVTDDTRVAKRLADSFVTVEFNVPHPTAGLKDFNYIGIGTIVDAERGLVLVDRDTVPVSLGDLVITFGGTVSVPGQLVYLHPTHNLAVLRYDPAALDGVSVRAVRWSNQRPSKGGRIYQAALNSRQELVTSKTTVSDYDSFQLGINSTPRFRDANVELIDIADSEGSLGGVLTDKRGRAVALWASFLDQASGDRGFRGLPRDFIEPVLAPLLRGEAPNYRTLGAELRTVSLRNARERGLPDAYLRQLVDEEPLVRALFEISRVTGGTPAVGNLEEADILLSIDGKYVTKMRQVESLHDQDQVRVQVLRDGQIVSFDVVTAAPDGDGVDRVVTWAGMILHEPHYEVAAQRGLEPRGIYATWLWYGSPAAQFGLRPTRRITQVNDTETLTLDDFIEAVRDLRDGDSVRLTVEGLDGTFMVQTLVLDEHYWPTSELRLRDGRWQRTSVGPGSK